MNLIINDEVNEMMEERGIQEDDMKEVIEYAESVEKLVDAEAGTNLGKKKLDAITLYVEYKMSGDDAEIINVYSHRVGFKNAQ